MDSARCAKRLGAKEVRIIYRRTEEEMPARVEEIKRAKEEGIIFELLTNPTRFFGDEKGWLVEAECIRNRLGSPDASGRRRPVPIEGSQFRVRLDTVVCAIGQGPNPLLLQTLPDLKLNEDGNIIVEENGMTSIGGVFAGGDIVTGAATVIEAMGAGKRAARAIHEYLTGAR
jgi:glutamate synthase (NADPH/NADH) small chain